MDDQDTAEYDALSPKAKVYIERVAKELYLLEHGWEDHADSRFWEQEVEGYKGDESRWTVNKYRNYALRCLRALLEVRGDAEAAGSAEAA